MKFRIFSHRGYKYENSLKGLKSSFSKGYRAIEFDIWYLEKKLILNHNRPEKPYENYDGFLEFLKPFKNQLYYWLDFKNLNKTNANNAIKEAKFIIDKLKINPSRLYFAPFITDIKKARPLYQIIRKYFGNEVQIVAVCEKLVKSNYQKYHQSLKENNIYGLSIEHKNINPEFMKIFSDVMIFAWTVNDKKRAEYLKEIGVQNIASDKLISLK